MRTFQNKRPQRTYSGIPKPRYQDYHNELREDFNHRCAYTDCSDSWWQDGFHVDHFAPKSPRIVDLTKKAKFEALKNDYSNLVYACPQVNRAKSDDWPSDDPAITELASKGYLDPCNNDFNDYFERTDSGGIVPKDHPISRYMWEKLQLYLIRYELYWRMEQLAFRYEELGRLKRSISLPAEIRQEASDLIDDLIDEHSKYKKYLDVNYREIIR